MYFTCNRIKWEDSNQFEFFTVQSNVFVCAVTIADYIIFEYDFESTIKTALWALVYPYAYFIFVYICYPFGMEYNPGQRFPYFFLNFEKNGWFSLKPIGVFWWVLIITAVVFGLGALYLCIKNARQKHAK